MFQGHIDQDGAAPVDATAIPDVLVFGGAPSMKTCPNVVASEHQSVAPRIVLSFRSNMPPVEAASVIPAVIVVDADLIAFRNKQRSKSCSRSMQAAAAPTINKLPAEDV